VARIIFTALAVGDTFADPYFAAITFTESDIERIQKAAKALEDGQLSHAAIRIGTDAAWGIPPENDDEKPSFRDDVAVERDDVAFLPAIEGLRKAQLYVRCFEKHGEGSYESHMAPIDDVIEAARSTEDLVFFEHGREASLFRLDAMIAEAKEDKGVE